MKDILRFILERKKFILVPVILVLLVLGVLLVVSSVSPGFSPFIYTFF